MKNKKHLTREQRYTISRMLQAGFTKKAVCIATGKDKSVISRELKRNASKRGSSPGPAQMYSDERKERFRRKRKFTPEVERRITGYLSGEQWSPEQITGWCRKNGIPTVSHERIYQYIRQNKQKGGTLWKHCLHRL
jgi:IS30 family transposase